MESRIGTRSSQFSWGAPVRLVPPLGYNPQIITETPARS